MKTWCCVALMVLCGSALADDDSWAAAERNGEQARKAFLACWNFTHGWLQHADPKTGLIPRNLKVDAYWNAKDSAADNYPFMVLSTWFTEPALFRGAMHDILAAEQKFSNRVGRLPDDYDFATGTFRVAEVKMADIVFGASEYVKDGLLPLTEWLGPSPWSERMIGLMDDIWKHAEIETEVGKVPAASHEVSGDLMQGLARLYWMTGNETYRTYAYQLAEFYFVHHLPIKEERLRLDDHGCEVIGGLSEVYFIAAHQDPDRHERWKPAMHAILDRILEVGRDDKGLLFSLINPVTGEKLTEDMTDNWGYNYNAFLVVDQLDQVPRYRQAVEHVLRHLPASKDYLWEGGSSDGYADSLEGCINLMNRVPSTEAAEWADYSAAIMLGKQRDTGVIEGWHGDGNFARTALMYALWKTQGTRLEPWRADVRLGAVRAEDGSVMISVTSDWPYQGRLRFDIPRHRENLHMPFDYPRLNQFPEWWTVSEDVTYLFDGQEEAGAVLRHEGWPVTAKPDAPFRLTIKRKEP